MQGSQRDQSRKPGIWVSRLSYRTLAISPRILHGWCQSGGKKDNTPGGKSFLPYLQDSAIVWKISTIFDRGSATEQYRGSRVRPKHTMVGRDLHQSLVQAPDVLPIASRRFARVEGRRQVPSATFWGCALNHALCSGPNKMASYASGSFHHAAGA